jgi:hypothetical protein
LRGAKSFALPFMRKTCAQRRFAALARLLAHLSLRLSGRYLGSLP